MISSSELNVTKGDVIVVSYVGYRNVETVWDGTNLRILLKSNAEELDEVVVVGYGVQKKVNLTEIGRASCRERV